jgi:hypothetical protein
MTGRREVGECQAFSCCVFLSAAVDSHGGQGLSVVMLKHNVLDWATGRAAAKAHHFRGAKGDVEAEGQRERNADLRLMSTE